MIGKTYLLKRYCDLEHIVCCGNSLECVILYLATLLLILNNFTNKCIVKVITRETGSLHSVIGKHFCILLMGKNRAVIQF